MNFGIVIQAFIIGFLVGAFITQHLYYKHDEEKYCEMFEASLYCDNQSKEGK